MLTVAFTARAVLALGGAGLAVAAARDLRFGREYAAGGVLTAVVEESARRRVRLLQWLSPWARYRAALLVQCALGALAPAAALWAPTPVAAVAACLLAGTAVLTLQRSSYGLDGSDQMFALAMIAGAGALLCGARLGRWFLYFLAAQLVLSYVIAGVAKLVSPVWRDGSCLERILATRAYSSPRTAGVLRTHPRLGLAMAWGVMLFEVSFAVVPFLDGPVLVAFLSAGALFHLGIVLTMHLTTFLFAFVSAYPAMVYVTGAVSV